MIKNILYKLGDLNKTRGLLKEEYLGFFPTRLNNMVLLPYFIEDENNNLQEILLLDVIQQVFNEKVFNKIKLDPFMVKSVVNSLILSRDIYDQHNKVHKTGNYFYISDNFLKNKETKFLNEDEFRTSEFLNSTKKWDVFTVSIKNVDKYNTYIKKIRNRTIDLLLDLNKIEKTHKDNQDKYIKESAKVFTLFLKDYLKLLKDKRKSFENIFREDFWGKKTYLNDFEISDVMNSLFGFVHFKNLNIVKDKLYEIKDSLKEEENLYDSLAKKINQNSNFVGTIEYFIDYIDSGGIIETIEKIVSNPKCIGLIEKQFQITRKINKMYNDDEDINYDKGYVQRVDFFIKESSNISISSKEIGIKYNKEITESIEKQVEEIKNRVKKKYYDDDSYFPTIAECFENFLLTRLREDFLLEKMKGIGKVEQKNVIRRQKI